MNDSETITQAQKARYGVQLTAEPLTFASVFLGSWTASSPIRLWQINKFVTRGLAPDGQPNGWSSGPAPSVAAQQSRTGGLWPSSPTTQGYKAAAMAAATLAITVRRAQKFLDGNHRTGLSAAVFALAEQGYSLAVDFPFQQAYALLSARHLFVTRSRPLQVHENHFTVLMGVEDGWLLVAEDLAALFQRHMARKDDTAGLLPRLLERVRDELPRSWAVRDAVKDEYSSISLAESQEKYRAALRDTVQARRIRLALMLDPRCLKSLGEHKYWQVGFRDMWRLSERWSRWEPLEWKGCEG